MVLSFLRRRPGRPGRLRRPAWLMMLAMLAACGDRAARVRLVPLGGACGRPLGGIQVKVTSFAPSGERSESVGLDESLAISDFPLDTEQIGVEVIIGGGATGAAGKSAPLAFDALADGATIPVFMAPLDGFCEVGSMTGPRARPLVARAGDGVLVVGGIGPDGPVSTAEYYDPVTATFSEVEVPQVLAEDAQGFTGAALATLPDGKVAVIGGPKDAFAVFDPALRAFARDPALIDSRAFHAALAIGDDDVLVAGGCSATTGPCEGVPQIVGYHVSQVSQPDRMLPSTADQRVGAQLFDLGIQLDGKRRFLLAGGTGDPQLGDRFALDDATTTVVPGGHSQTVALDGGAVLAAFAGDGAAADGEASVFAPDAPVARAITSAPDLAQVRLIGLEDGRVMGFGGAAMGRVVTYDPTHDAWDVADAASADQTGEIMAPSLVRLADGAVLVLGGAVSARAWLYRPSLVGPASGSVAAIPASDIGRGVLTALDPASVVRTQAPGEWRLIVPGDAPGAAAMARALVGGPRMVTGSVSAVVHVRRGGVALIAQQLGPGQAIVAEVAPDQPPRLVQLDGGVEHTVCSPPPSLAAFDPARPVTLRLAISDHDARLALDGAEILACGLVATDRGSWGMAALGAGADVVVDSVTVAR
ncbi:MAG TPA: kelch repeat-containing protein [Kofleriaceae bacterium]|nr:kelch repeat-containing protein [Kofleriaceae bacterium]